MAYLLDRAKPLRRWRDPADRMANPARDAWVQRHRAGLLVGASSLGVTACGLALLVDPRLLPLTPIGAASVVIYGARPTASRRLRPKDVLIAKNLLTGLAYATLIGGVLWATLPETRGLWRALAVAGLLVTGDAMLSDIDDTPADAAFGTTTVAVLAGRRWATALALTVYAAAAAVWLRAGGWSAGGAVLALGMPATGLGISRHARVRTAIDLRAAPLAALAVATRAALA